MQDSHWLKYFDTVIFDPPNNNDNQEDCLSNSRQVTSSRSCSSVLVLWRRCGWCDVTLCRGFLFDKLIVRRWTDLKRKKEIETWHFDWARTVLPQTRLSSQGRQLELQRTDPPFAPSPRQPRACDVCAVDSDDESEPEQDERLFNHASQNVSDWVEPHPTARSRSMKKKTQKTTMVAPRRDAPRCSGPKQSEIKPWGVVVSCKFASSNHKF